MATERKKIDTSLRIYMMSLVVVPVEQKKTNED